MGDRLLPEELPRYIAIEGPIGVGKTTLANKLALQFNYELMLEAPADNPFLTRFYEDRKEVALPTQLFFLFERIRQVQSLRQADLFNTATVADFILAKDPLFARVNLDADELKLYNDVYNHVSIDAPVPDLVIYLQAPVNVLQSRIRQRGIPMEQSIEASYLQELSDAYTELFHFYDTSPLLIVNAAEVDLSEDDAEFGRLVETLVKVKTGRHYYNPGQSMI